MASWFFILYGDNRILTVLHQLFPPRRCSELERRSREKASSNLRRWNNLRGLRSGNSRRGLVGVETKIADVPAMASDRQREISRTRADIENDVTLAERHMANETVAPHALARRHRDAEIIKGRQEEIGRAHV